jgi:uncharacterized integral membrane protein (TIGR00698 family)
MNQFRAGALGLRPARAVALRVRGWLPGTGLSGVIALAATSVSTLHGGPQLLYALFFGIAFNYLSEEPKTKPGLDFCARTLLRLGVSLLGARITATQIVSLGWPTALVTVAGVVTTIGLGLLLARSLRLSAAQGVLSGGSVAICGASAALAIAAVLPRERESERFTVMVVVTVTVLSTVAMVLYPLIAKGFALPPALAGLFLGATIHDVAQVVGAGYTLGNEAGDIAVIVKLFRVSLLAVVVVLIAMAFRSIGARTREGEAGGAFVERQALVPWFLWVFVGMVTLNTAGAFSTQVQSAVNDVSRACLVMAIAALGTKTSFRQLARAGWRPFVLILAESVWLAALVLGCALLG